jgi:Protein of unknown function DUF262
MDKLPSLNLPSLYRNQIGSGDLCIAQGKRILDLKFDFDVFLPSLGVNLQRPLVWTIEQKRSLIESVLIRRLVPPVSVILTNDDVLEVIDGKQRLTALIEYIRGDFDFCGYYCDELPIDYLGQIKRHHVTAYWLCEYDGPISDEDKIEWFRWINFAGTPQDVAHMKRLNAR